MDIRRGRRAARSDRARWGAALKGLDLQEPWTTAGLLRAYVQDVRGNKLIISEDPDLATANGPSGLWIAAPGVDMVWCHPSVPRSSVLGHELGHMVNGDQPKHLARDTVMAAVIDGFQHLDTKLVRGALMRSGYSDLQEASAEAFSTWAGAQLSMGQQPEKDPLLANLRASLDTRRAYW